MSHRHPTLADYHLGLAFAILAVLFFLIAAVLAFGAFDGGPGPIGPLALGLASWSLGQFFP